MGSVLFCLGGGVLDFSRCSSATKEKLTRRAREMLLEGSSLKSFVGSQIMFD